MRALYYHSTELKNLPGIARWGILPGQDGYVHLCKDPLDAFEFGYEKAILDDYNLFIVIPAMIDDLNLSKYKVNTVFSTVPFDCVKHEGRISNKCLALLDEDLSYYSIHPYSGSIESLKNRLLLQELLK